MTEEECKIIPLGGMIDPLYNKEERLRVLKERNEEEKAIKEAKLRIEKILYW